MRTKKKNILHQPWRRRNFCDRCGSQLVVLWHDKQNYQRVCLKCDRNLIRTQKEKGATIYNPEEVRRTIIGPHDSAGFSEKIPFIKKRVTCLSCNHFDITESRCLYGKRKMNPNFERYCKYYGKKGY